MSRFDAARRAALAHDVLAALTGRPADLLPFEAVKERLHLRRIVDRGIEEVPLDRIRGSVGRDREFNRAFYPREEMLRERWDDVRGLAEGTAGFPPVELYRVGDVDFVVDGHHRVSVARSLGAESIEARVREFVSPVPLPADASLEDVLSREGLVDFLEATGLAAEEPDAYRVTEPGGYDKLLDHVAVHRFYLGLSWRRPFSWDESVASWRDLVYRPMVEAIRRSGLLDELPARTETDAYLFVMDHLHNLRKRWGTRATRPSRAVAHFRLTLPRPSRVGRLLDWWTGRRGR